MGGTLCKTLIAITIEASLGAAWADPFRIPFSGLVVPVPTLTGSGGGEGHARIR